MERSSEPDTTNDGLGEETNKAFQPIRTEQQYIKADFIKQMHVSRYGVSAVLAEVNFIFPISLCYWIILQTNIGSWCHGNCACWCSAHILCAHQPGRSERNFSHRRRVQPNKLKQTSQRSIQTFLPVHYTTNRRWPNVTSLDMLPARSLISCAIARSVGAGLKDAPRRAVSCHCHP